MSRLLLALASLVVAACCLPLPKNVACATLSIGNTKLNSKTETFELKPIRLNGVTGGGAEITIPRKVPATKTLVGEAVKVCNTLSKTKPGVISKLGSYFNIEVLTNVPWPSSTDLIIYTVQYGKLKSAT